MSRANYHRVEAHPFNQRKERVLAKIWNYFTRFEKTTYKNTAITIAAKTAIIGKCIFCGNESSGNFMT